MINKSNEEKERFKAEFSIENQISMEEPASNEPNICPNPDANITPRNRFSDAEDFQEENDTSLNKNRKKKIQPTKLNA